VRLDVKRKKHSTPESECDSNEWRVRSL
jgi:hypothetical protein